MTEWDRCAPWIEAALKGQKLTIAEVERGLAHGHFHLWAHDQGAVVTEFVISPRSKGLHLFAGGGTAEAMWALLPLIEAWAKEQGCDAVGVTGRKGWRRALRGAGYALSSTIVKDI